jgi:NitT/TauT family transport system permease protein
VNTRQLYPVATLGAVAILWEAAVIVFRIPRFLLPAPTDIWDAGMKNWSTLMSNSAVTVGETMAGFGLSIAVGVPLAILIVYSRTLEQILYPLLVASQTVPKIAIAPLFVVWLGFSSLPKVLVAFLIAFFPIVIDTVIGLESADPDTLQLVRSMGASTWDTFRKIRFPSAMPNIFGGLKVAMTLAVVGAIVGEFVGSNSGLGYLLLVATGNIDTPLLFADIVVLTLIGVTLFYIVELFERIMTPWHPRTRAEDLANVTL